MFLVFNREKIQTYIVSVLTVAVLITIANIGNIKTVQTSATQKYLPIYNVKTEENKIAFTMNCAWSSDDIDQILEVLKSGKRKGYDNVYEMFKELDEDIANGRI